MPVPFKIFIGNRLNGKTFFKTYVMMEKDKEYWVNNPLFLKYKRKFDFASFKSVNYLKSAFLNERIVEIPFVLDALSRGAKCGKVLDFGCSESLLPLYVSALGYQVTGVDLRDYPFFAPNFTFIKADILKDNFTILQKGTFDALLCISVLEHVGLGCYSDAPSESQADLIAVRKLAEFLRHQGLFILTVPFGIKQTTAWQRFYDFAGINRLLEGFIPKQMRYYAWDRRPQDRCNHWREVSLIEAEKIRSEDYVGCVCCVCAERH